MTAQLKLEKPPKRKAAKTTERSKTKEGIWEGAEHEHEDEECSNRSSSSSYRNH